MIGSFPDCEGDVRYMKSLGITGVINLLSDQELLNFDYDKIQMIRMYQNEGINFSKHLPLDEMVDDPAEQAEKVYNAA